MIEATISFAPVNNPKGASKEQREALEKAIIEGKVSGTKEGIDQLTFEDCEWLLKWVAKYGARRKIQS